MRNLQIPRCLPGRKSDAPLVSVPLFSEPTPHMAAAYPVDSAINRRVRPSARCPYEQPSRIADVLLRATKWRQVVLWGGLRKGDLTALRCGRDRQLGAEHAPAHRHGCAYAVGLCHPATPGFSYLAIPFQVEVGSFLACLPLTLTLLPCTAHRHQQQRAHAGWRRDDCSM